MHQIAPFLSFIFRTPYSASLNQNHNRANYTPGMLLYLGNLMALIKTFMNVDQIYSYKLKLKLNLRIGPNSNYYGYKNKCFHFV